MVDYYLDNILRERRDDVLRVYTAWDEFGLIVEERPYTNEENITADINVTTSTFKSNKSSIEINLEEDLTAMQAIKDQTNAELREDSSQEIKDIASAVKRLIKVQLEDYSEVD